MEKTRSWSELRIQWLKALTLSQKSFLIGQPVRSNFQIIIRPHNAYFLKKVILGEKIDYFEENPKLSKLIQIQWNEM